MVEAVEELAQIAGAMAAAPALASSATQHELETSTAGQQTDVERGECEGEGAEDGDAAGAELGQRMAALRIDNERLEVDRLEMGQRLGEYRAAVAKVGLAVEVGWDGLGGVAIHELLAHRSWLKGAELSQTARFATTQPENSPPKNRSWKAP